MKKDTLTDVDGIKVGHAHNEKTKTGCTVVLTGKNGAIGGVDVRGGAPGSRENVLLQPEMKVDSVHAILLTGGSAFGLEAAGGVMQYLREKNVGFETSTIAVPIVPASVIYDLNCGEIDFPDEKMGYEAADRARVGDKSRGNVGAGCGATVGNIKGENFSMQGGLAGASLRLKNGTVLGAMAVVNCLGEVIDPETGKVLAGVYDRNEGTFYRTADIMEEMDAKKDMASENTLLGVVATDAALSSSEAKKLAQFAQNGIARAVRPAHTMMDGDTVYALSTGDKKCDLSLLGERAAELMEKSICRAVTGNKL